MKLQRYSNNPILSPNPNTNWENAVTTNPGAWYDEEKEEFCLLYRAAGDDPEHKIYLGLARSKDGYSFERVSDQPVFSPDENGFDTGCVEDPRVIKIGEWYYITYAFRPFPPGQYWLPLNERSYLPPEMPEDAPVALRDNLSGTGLVLTKDFKKFIRAGRITNPMVDDRDVLYFPEKINGKYFLLHRPKDGFANELYPTDLPTIWIASSEDMLHFENSQILIKRRQEWEGKIGANCPPIKTPQGWFVLYHAVGPDNHYRLGALLLDLNNPTKVLHRTPDWLLQPEEDYEINGYYPGVVFPCGNVVKDDTLFVYYGGADKYVGLATCSFSELLKHLQACSA